MLFHTPAILVRFNQMVSEALGQDGMFKYNFKAIGEVVIGILVNEGGHEYARCMDAREHGIFGDFIEAKGDIY